MKSTTIRQLKHETSKVLGWVADGQTVEVQRRKEPIAVLAPVRPGLRVRRPNFEARIRQVYGGTILDQSATELIAEARGER